MKNKLQVTKYNVTRAKWYFALFKFLELMGVFLFTFGFYGLGILVLKHCSWFYNFSYVSNSACTSYLCIWFTGFLAFFSIFASLFLGGVILYWIYKIIKAWIKGNWNLAKKVAEDKTSKAKRLKLKKVLEKERELNKKRLDRSRWGYCVGDEVKILSRNRHPGEKGKIVRCDSDGEVKVFVGGHYHIFRNTVCKVTKKYPIKLATQKLK